MASVLRRRATRLASARRHLSLPTVLTFGEALYTFKPLPLGAMVEGGAMPPFAPGATTVLRAIGGAELNTAVALANLSGQPGSVGFVSVLPTGALGDEVVRVASTAGVATDAVHRSDRCDVLGTLHVVDADGLGPRPLYQRHGSAFCTTINAQTHDWRALLDGPRWLHLTGITPALGAGPRAAWDAALSAAAEASGAAGAPLRVSLDLNHRPALGSLESLWAAVKPHLSTLTLLILSEPTMRALAKAEGVAPPPAPLPSRAGEGTGREGAGADRSTEQPSAAELLSQMRRVWGIPLLACCFKRPLSTTDLSRGRPVVAPGRTPARVEHAPRVTDTTHGGAGVRRWSLVAHPSGIASTEACPTQHTPVEALGGGDAWVAGFIHAAVHEPRVAAAVDAAVGAAGSRAGGSAGGIFWGLQAAGRNGPPVCNSDAVNDISRHAAWGADAPAVGGAANAPAGVDAPWSASLRLAARRGDLLAGLQMTTLGDLSGVSADELRAAEARWDGVPAQLGAATPTPPVSSGAWRGAALSAERPAQRFVTGADAALSSPEVRAPTPEEVEVFSRFEACGIVPVVALDDCDQAVPVAHALLAGGIDVMELVLRTPAAERALALVASHVPRMLVGAGTVLTVAQAGRAAGAGARFLVAPGTNPTIVKHAHAAGLPILPGVATATEVEAAFALGLTRLKFFPAVPMGGAKTLGALSAPYPHARWMPTGGVSPANLEDFFRLKQVFAAGGAWVVPRDALAARDYARVEALAREATQAVKALRSDSR